MKNTDTRVQYTKARFAEAMVTLLERQPIGSVSVKALCEEAGLNRGTFYLHYNEPIDLLREMEWAFATRIGFHLPPVGPHSSAEAFLRLLTSLRQEERLCSVLIGRSGDPIFLFAVRDKAFSKMEEQLKTELPGIGDGELRLRFDFLFSGFTGVVSAWLKGNGLTDLETAQMLEQLCNSVLKEQ